MTTMRSAGVAAIFMMFFAGIVSVSAQESALMDTDAVVASAKTVESDDAQSRAGFRSLDEDVQSLKKEVLDLNRDLFLLEEELLFPANSQVAFFISMDVGEYFELDSINLTIEGIEVAN